MNRVKSDRRRRSENGAAVVEFALVLPIFLALIFGVISYGYMLSYRQAVSQGAIEAARAAALAPPNMDNAKRLDRSIAAADYSLKSYGVECNDGVVKCEVIPAQDCGETVCVHVKVSHDYRDHPLIPAFPGLGIVLPKTIAYTAEVERG